MPYFIEFLIDNWFIVIPLIFSLFALYLLDRISKAINLEPHKGVVLINKKNAVVIDIRSQKEFDEGKISQARHVGPDLEVCKKEIEKADGNPVILVCQNGTNSSRMASDLKKEQISVFVLKGGINNWISEKLPLVN